MTFEYVVKIFLVIFLMAFLVESMVEAVLGTPMKKIPKLKPWTWLLMYVAMAIGVVGAYLYRFDLLYLLGVVLQVDIHITPFGLIGTGLAIGRGSNYIHDLFMRIFKGNPLTDNKPPTPIPQLE